MFRKLFILLLLTVFPIHVLNDRTESKSEGKDRNLLLELQFCIDSSGMLSMLLNPATKRARKLLFVFLLILFLLAVQSTFLFKYLCEDKSKTSEENRKNDNVTSLYEVKGDEYETTLYECGDKQLRPWYFDFRPHDQLQRDEIKVYVLDSYFKEVLDNNDGKEILMKHEWARLESFKTFPVESPAHAVRLVQTGFYYKGNQDIVTCFSCGVEHGKWEFGDIPSLIHKQISPRCKFLSGEDKSNVPIHENDTGHVTETEAELSTDACAESSPLQTDGASSKVTINQQSLVTALPFKLTEGAKHPEFADTARRAETFCDWPCGHVIQPDILITAGFAYAGYSDCVRCYYCGIGLRNWEAGDDPLVEHTNWSSNCRHLMALKQIRETATLQPVTSTDNRTSQTNENKQAASTNQHGVQAKDEKKTITERKKDENQTENGRKKEENGRKKDENKTENRRKKHENKTENRRKKHDKKTKDEKKTNTKTPPDQALKMPSNTNTSPNKGTKTSSTNNNQTSAKGSDNDDSTIIKDENSKMRSIMTCKVCMDLPTNTVLIPCGHYITCETCSHNVRKCPMCRTRIETRISVNSG